MSAPIAKRRGTAVQRRASPAILAFRRQELERWIEEAIALLDQIDGDPDLEDDEREPEESDQDGDEQDTLFSEDDNLAGGRFRLGRMEGGPGL